MCPERPIDRNFFDHACVLVRLTVNPAHAWFTTYPYGPEQPVTTGNRFEHIARLARVVVEASGPLTGGDHSFGR